MSAQLPPGIDLSKLPAKQPPPGVIPDFTKRAELLNFTIAISAIFVPLMWTFLGIRLYMRVGRREKWMVDDWFAVVTAIAVTGLSGLILATAPNLARHSWDVPISYVIAARTQKFMYAQQFLNCASLWLGKMCLLTMYNRIFGHIQKVRWQLYGAAALTLPLFIAIFLQSALVAPAPGKPWGTPNPLVEKAAITGFMVGVDNLVVDFAILIIPLPVVRRLNLSPSRKKGVTALFATGMIAVITDIITFYFRVRVFQRVDQLLYGYIAHNCSLIEAAISVILSSLPSFAKLWRVYIEPSTFYQTLRSRLTSQRGSENDSDNHHELPTFIKEAHAQPPKTKKKDPYALPTTNLSQARLSGGEALELTPPKQGRVDVQVSSVFPEERERPSVGDINRRVSVEQSSFSYAEPGKLRTERNML